VRRSPVLLALAMTFIRWCPETGDEVDVEVTLRGTWCPGEPGNFYDPPVPPGVEDVWAVANGRDFPLSLRERDWAAELLAGEVE
jgi:hypothetical protein